MMVLAAGCSARAGGGGYAPPDDGAVAPDVTQPGDVPPGVDVPAADTAPPPPQTYDYVISQYVVDGSASGAAPTPATSTVGLAGFNLDGLYSTSADAAVLGGPACGHADYFSTLDPDQNMGACASGAARGGSACMGGVDNQLPQIASTVQGLGSDLRADFAMQAQTGRALVLLRVEGVDGTPGPGFNDDSVNVSVYSVGRALFASCAQVNTPGSMFAVDNASLNTAGDLRSAKIRFGARILNGRLVTALSSSDTPNFSLGLPLMGMSVPLGLIKTQLRVDLTPDRAANGNLGGYAQLAPLAAMIGTVLPAGVPVSSLQALLQSLVDVQVPQGSATGCMAPNGGISIGLGFTAVRAVIAPMAVTGPVVGNCGATVQ